MSVYVFFDESGNLDFSPGGTRFIVFGALTTRTPADLLRPLSDLRYDLLAQGHEIECFHATEDRQIVRDQVFGVLERMTNFDFDAVIVEKRKVFPSLQDPLRFYPQFASYLLQYIFARYDDPSEPIVIVTDKVPVRKFRSALEKTFKGYIRSHLGDRPFNLVHHASASHACLQGADYCNWAIYKKWTNGELRPHESIRHLVRSEFDILAHGSTYHY